MNNLDKLYNEPDECIDAYVEVEGTLWGDVSGHIVEFAPDGVIIRLLNGKEIKVYKDMITHIRL